MSDREYTADQMLDVAERRLGWRPTRRLVTEWVQVGLLDRATPRGRGRGKGKQYTWPHNQLELFIQVLAKHKTVRRPTLCNMPVTMWLFFGDAYVPLRQVRRALKTWAATYATGSFTQAKATAEQVLVQLDHPDASREDREHLRRLVTQAGTGKLDADALEDAARKVFDPHATGMSRGPMGLMDAESYVRVIKARVTGLSVIATAPDETYLHARNAYQSTDATNEQLRAPLDQQRGVTSGKAIGASNAGVQAAFNRACLDLIMLLGFMTLNPPTLGHNRRPSWDPPKGRPLNR